MPKSIQHLNSVLRMIVLKIQEDRSNRTKIIVWKPLCLQTNNNDDRPTTDYDCMWSYQKHQNKTLSGSNFKTYKLIKYIE